MARRRKSEPRPLPFTRERIEGGHPRLIGYARVSTRDQSLSSQQDELRAAGCSVIYSERVSSAAHRAGWAALAEQLRKGDVVVVYALDRIGRRLSEVVTTIDAIHAQGAYVRALRNAIDTRGPAGKTMIPLWAALAETERTLISERTKAGLAAAARRGRFPGRPPRIDDAGRRVIAALSAEGHSAAAIARTLRVGETTVRRAMQELTRADPRQLSIDAISQAAE